MNPNTETVMGAAFKRAGGKSHHEITLRAAIAACVSNYESEDWVLEKVHEFFNEMRAAGRNDYRRKDGNNGQQGRAAKASLSLPNPSDSSGSNAGGSAKGHITNADKVSEPLPAALPKDKNVLVKPFTRSKPNRTKRTPEALLRQGAAIAKSIFDTYKLADGRAIGDVAWSELPFIVKKYNQNATVAKLLYDFTVPANSALPVREIVKEVVLKDIIATAKVKNND